MQWKRWLIVTIGVAAVAANGAAVWLLLRSDVAQAGEADRSVSHEGGVDVPRGASSEPVLEGTSPAAPAASEQEPGDDHASLAKAIADLEARGELPILDRTDSLTGIDADGNGIRDDLDRYIDRSFGDPAQREAAIRLTKTIQQTLLVDLSNHVRLMEVARRHTRDLACFSSKFDHDDAAGSQHRAQLHSLTTNTKARLLAYLRFDRALSGQVFRMPEGDGCE